jgi:hypothetical protein
VSGPGLADRYTKITPAPAEWPEVRMHMMADGLLPISLDGSWTGTTTRLPFERVLSDLGQPATDRHSTQTVSERDAAFAAVVAQARALA